MVGRLLSFWEVLFSGGYVKLPWGTPMVTIVTAQGASGVGSHDVTLTGPWMESVHEEVRKSLQLLHPQQQVVVKNPPKKPGEDDFTAGWNLQIPITYLKRKESMI